MGLARIHDFITGATVTLVTPETDASADLDRIDILRPNARARALLDQHREVLQGMARPADPAPPLN